MKHAILSFLTFVWLLTTGAAGAEEYRIATGDVLRIRIFDQPDLSLDATKVQSGGLIMLPKLGVVTLGGLTVGESRDLIQNRLLVEQGVPHPDVLVEITKHRPIFVVGDVTQSGDYEYVPGMNVLQAISLAGGFARPQVSDATLRLDQGRLREELGQYVLQRASVRVLLARLLAERDGTGLADLPEGLGFISADRLADLVGQERALMQKRQQNHDGQLEILAKLQSELDNEIEALNAQYAAKEKQTELAENEARQVQDLRQRDLVALSRVLAVDSAVLQLGADKLEILAYISRAKTARSRIDQDALNLKAQRDLEILNGIKTQQDTLVQLDALIAAHESQIATIDRLGTGLAPDHFAVEQYLGVEKISVVRKSAAGQQIFPVSFLDKLQPDDLLIVPNQPISAGPSSTAASN